jgi:hypothetical protein
VKGSDRFRDLVGAEIVAKVSAGRGFKYRVEKPMAFDQFFRTHFPEDTQLQDKRDNVRQFRDSKAVRTDGHTLFVLRGQTEVVCDGMPVDLGHFTRAFGLFACCSRRIEARRIGIVENFDTFMEGERRFGSDFVFLHKYGRLGVADAHILQTPELWVFVDFDFNGLDEYLRIREGHAHARLYVPEDYDRLFAQYSKSLQGNQARMSARVRNALDPDVVRIRESNLRHNRFLEQQYH